MIHIRALKQALDHRLKLKKVHRIIEFRQEQWLKPYNDMNTELRNNSAYGKTMENVFLYMLLLTDITKISVSNNI